MLFTYYLNRGLDCVALLASNFRDRTWWLPDLICDEVVEVVQNNVKNIEFYHIEENLNWSTTITGSNPKVFFAIDYFGKETNLTGAAPPNTIVIRDSIWFPYPFAPVETNQIWFNSLRKIFHGVRGIKGANILSPFRLYGADEVQNLFRHPNMTWAEVNKRFENYYFCKEIFAKHVIPGHEQQFPSVFPIILKDRDRVLANLGIPLPGMWANRHNLPNSLYKKLAFIPIDSRSNKESLINIASKINELI